MTDDARTETTPLDAALDDTTPLDAVSSDEGARGDEVAADDGLRPRTRWGAALWGLLVVLAGTAVLTILSDRGRTAAFADWLGGLTVGAVVVILVLAAGGLVLLLALLALVRRAQRAAR
jgi:uncharacterized membrane protein YcjF (UPF0283 family)